VKANPYLVKTRNLRGLGSNSVIHETVARLSVLVRDLYGSGSRRSILTCAINPNHFLGELLQSLHAQVDMNGKNQGIKGQ
jgi:hypothetical protein